MKITTETIRTATEMIESLTAKKGYEAAIESLALFMDPEVLRIAEATYWAEQRIIDRAADHKIEITER
jgi:hypothetical protein